MRSEFEKLPEIAEKLKHVWWNEGGNQYCDTGKHPNNNGAFLNGALYAYQEQQKRINELKTKIQDLSFEFGSYSDPYNMDVNLAFNDIVQRLNEITE